MSFFETPRTSDGKTDVLKNFTVSVTYEISAFKVEELVKFDDFNEKLPVQDWMGE